MDTWDEDDVYEVLLGHQFLNGMPRMWPEGTGNQQEYYRMKHLLETVGIEGIRKMDYEKRQEVMRETMDKWQPYHDARYKEKAWKQGARSV